MRYTFFLLSILGVFSWSSLGEAQSFLDRVQDERIIDFHSNVKIESDASLLVTETIKVWCLGRRINHGIYRDFPTDYKDRNGNNILVSFNVIDVLRDGKPEYWVIEAMTNGQRVRIGSNNDFLEPGKVYTYTIKYKTTRQIGFFPDHDELYWNVIGNGWDFRIQTATCEVTLPVEIPEDKLSFTAYTGPQGARRGIYQSFVDSSHNIIFIAKNLLSTQGLTIVVGFPKGIVSEPSKQTRIEWFFYDNAVYLVGILGLIFLLIYYLIVWFIFGKDMPHGIIIPLFGPPKDMTPAAVRYVRLMDFDQKVFTAVIISLAVKGYLTISKEKSLYTLTRINPENANSLAGLPLEERTVAHRLFETTNSLELIQANHEIISDAIDNLRNSLSEKYLKRYFFTNFQYVLFGYGVSAILAIIMVCTIIIQNSSSPYAIFTLVVFVAIVIKLNFLFKYLMKAPTKTGRKILDQIEGFLMYLGTAEKERLKLMNPPLQTPELFEKFLPYALALDVELLWAEQFTNVLKAASADNKEYTPRWYICTDYTSSRTSSFSSSLEGSFSRAISAAIGAPGSSSGFGSGFAGGGGGGGGGW